VQAQDLWVFAAVSVSSAGAQALILSPMLSSWSWNWNSSSLDEELMVPDDC